MTEVPAATPLRMAAPEREAVRSAIDRVLTGGPWIGGPEVDGFEHEFAEFLGGGTVVGCGNGTDALALAVSGLDLPTGSGVLVAANEGGYAATAIRMAGLVPVVMDVDPGTGAPGVATASAADREDLSAIVITHLHGNPVDIGELDAWRRGRGLALVEDCAQAHGARIGGRRVGVLGDAAAFSFYPTKNLAAVGDAGASVFADPAAAGRARALAQFGWQPRFTVTFAGGRNSRLDPLQAAVLRARLPFLDRRNEQRRTNLATYRDAAPRLSFLGDPASTVAHHAVVRSGRRDSLAAHLAGHGIRTAVHHPVVLGDMPGLALAPFETPGARQHVAEILSVPCTPELTPDEVERVASALASWEGP